MKIVSVLEKTQNISSSQQGQMEKHNLCYACNLPIVDQYLSKVLNKVWHNDCVKCVECQKTLAERCFSRKDKIYCKADFCRLFGAHCFSCEEKINSSDLIRKVDEHVYHLRCLRCYQCNRQIETGERLYKNEDDKLICKTDYESSKGKSISDSSPVSDESEDKNTASNGSDDEDANGKRRGPRTTIKAKQLETLKSAFASTPKPSRHIREKLAHETGLNMRVIQVWFQNKRSKERRLKQLSVLGGRRGTGRSKLDRRSERDSIASSSPESTSVSYQFFPGVTPNSLVSTMLEDFNSNRIDFPVGMVTNNNMMDQPIIKQEFTSMDVNHTSAFSFVDSLNHQESHSMSSYSAAHHMIPSHINSASDVW